MARNVLVTGAGGFIGYNLGNYLARQEYHVTGLDLHFPENPGTERPRLFNAVQGDFRDSSLLNELLEGADVLFHLASAHLKQSLDDSDYWNINVESLPALYEAARTHGVQRVVHVSSCGVYGRLQNCPADEHTPCQPQSVYGRTKLEGEKVALDFASENGVSVIVLRPSWVFGAGCPRTAKLYRALRKRRFPMIGRCQNLRHPLYIDDFLLACERAMQYDVRGQELFVIAGNEPVTSSELIDAFCEAYSLSRPWLRVPYPMGFAMGASAEWVFKLLGREPPISRRTLEFFDTDNAFDISKATEKLDFVPRFSLQRGLLETKSWLESMAFPP